jgi:hypothetical protein
MAGGANKQFLDEKSDFLKHNIIEVNVTAAKLSEIADNHNDVAKGFFARQGRLTNRDVDRANFYSGVYDFDLIKTVKKAKVRASTVGIQHWSSVTVYELKEWGSKTRDQKILNNPDGTFKVRYEVPKGAHPIRAYWVPWSSNTAWSVRLGDDADFFFTPTMDGCSLAISSGASPTVTHGNYKGLVNVAIADQARTLQQMTDHHTNTLGTDVNRTLLKDTYAATAQEKEAGTNKLVTVVGFRDRIAGTWAFYWQRRQVNANDPAAKIILQDRLVPI